jgi:hypothetical protein
MKRFIFIFLVFTLYGCANHAKNLNGQWTQLFMGFGENTTEQNYISDSAQIDLQLISPSKITFDYRDGLDVDQSDSIEFKYPKLVFRKLNYNQTVNRYSMNYNPSCDCFEGHFMSFNGNKILVRWVRNGTASKL